MNRIVEIKCTIFDIDQSIEAIRKRATELVETRNKLMAELVKELKDAEVKKASQISPLKAPSTNPANPAD